MTTDQKSVDFDFDSWAKMAQQDPGKFEQMRQQLIDETIEQTPDHHKQRMRGLQWQIDQIREQAGNPMAACLQIYQKMLDSLCGEKGLIKALQEPERLRLSLKQDKAKVISLEEYKTK